MADRLVLAERTTWPLVDVRVRAPLAEQVLLAWDKRAPVARELPVVARAPMKARPALLDRFR